MTSKTLFEHLDNSFQGTLKVKQDTVYEESKKYWSEEKKSDESKDVVSEVSLTEKMISKLTATGKSNHEIVEILNAYESKVGDKLTEGQKSILESTKKKLTESNGE